MVTLEVETRPCPGCGQTAWFSMTQEQFNRFKSGERVQDIFPDWSDDDREMLLTGYCPKCWEEMLPEEDEEDSEGEIGWMITNEGMAALERELRGVHGDLMGNEGDQPEYDSDYYVD